MRSIIFIFIIQCLFFFTMKAQSSKDSIMMWKNPFGYQFYQGGKRLNKTRLIKTMYQNKQAFGQLKSAYTTMRYANIIGGVGGAFVGWPLGTYLAGREPKWALAGVGAVLIITSVPLSQKFNRQISEAVDIYNGGLKTTYVRDRTDLRLSFTLNGIGLNLKF